MDYELTTLANGLRLLHIMRPGARVSWCGLAVNAGSRDDPPDRQGLAHFVEHTLFKGTTHRRAGHILNRMETVGGELNAYTTKEGTMLYSVFPSGYEARAIELIADLVQCSVFPERELDLEREVVLEEAASYRDSPVDAVYDDFEDLAFAGHALGHNILGIEQHIRAITPADCRRWLDTLYVPQNMVFFSLGPKAASRIFALAGRHFGGMNHPLQRTPRTAPPVAAPFVRESQIDAHQCHTVVGARVPGMHQPGRWAMALLSNILGGPGMNSLLNVALRERRGLVYTVESSVASFTDCGLMEIYLGCEPGKLRKSLDLVTRTLDRLALMPLSDKRLEACKRQYCGQLLLASDSAEFQALNAGKSLLYGGRVATVDDTVRHIQAVTAQQLCEAAALLAAPCRSALTLR